jgi:hypothetical protein
MSKFDAKEYRKKYLNDKERTAESLRRMEKKYGWQGVMASFQAWMKNPYRRGFDYWVKDGEEK